jgi:hypothetical protein
LPYDDYRLDADALLAVLKTCLPHREVYRAQNGEWFVTYGGNQTTYDAVKQLLERGEIASVYSNCPDQAYHVGRTIDMGATMIARKSDRRAPLVYI